MLQICGAIACALSVLAFMPYIRDTLLGNTRPERASWLIWTVLSSISFFSQIYEGAGLSLWFAGAQVSVTAIIFLLSIRLGHGLYITEINKKLYAITFVGLLTSFIYDSAVYALAVSILISLAGGAKTVVKAFHHPATETISTWLMALLASVFGLISVGKPDPVLLAYPMYLIVIYGSVIIAILAGRRQQAHACSQPEQVQVKY